MRGIVRRELFPIAGVFTISRGSRTVAEVVSVELIDGPHRGMGECVPYPRYGETQEGVIEEIENWLASGGGSRMALQSEMKPGAARNALDCAFWDLEAKRAGKRVWELAGLATPGPEITAYTLSLASPEEMEAKARENAHRPLLKIKLGGGEEDIVRLRAVREGAPGAKMIVDANEGWTLDLYTEIAPTLLELGVAMVEQPLPAGDDAPLLGARRPLPVCADEAAHDRESLKGLTGKYDMINIKLDKTGGLTEALALREAARAAGLKVMVGCMIGSSLAMAPAVLAAQGAEFTDLDGPLLLARDRRPGLLFDERGAHPPATELWG
ncbi:dipeptide epimerase [Pikeienuella piscinae]|uniref:Dipeptide epimerase n=1 Tax=Pikeienuella piscinae TaxID=2748098 RepID=A0A7L5BYE6_9RHOB|nr:N-acetyl-D-Glu racemase DgcA [Pikeienuella piscinae]QIE56471.1 dipeptide epimerase [Pikeienuella piscinae]